MPAMTPGWPTLSELRSADYSYFGQLAGYLEKISPQAQTALQDLAEDVKRPGGVDWEGDAGDAAIAEAEADLVRARPVMWSWEDVAVSARRWQDELQAGTRTALDAVDDAERDGFAVTQGYRCNDTRRSATEAEFAQRVAAAEAHANYIRHHVATLVANESRINGELKAMTAGWGTLTFPQSGGGVKAQPVDRTFKQGPDQPTPDPGRHADYPDHKPNGEWARGNSGVEGYPEEQQAFDDREEQTHIPIEREKIRVTLTDPTTGKTLTREYDGLEPIPGQPGKYLGLEHKLGQKGLTPPQRLFDGLVEDGIPAQGTLNGKPIEVIDTDIVKTPRSLPIPDPAEGLPGAAPGASGPGSAPVISAPPNLPNLLDHPPTAVPPTVLDHPAAPVPPTLLDHPPLPPWLQDPSPPGFHVSPGEPPTFAPFDTPGDNIPLPQHSPPLTLHMPDLHAPDMQLSPQQQQSLLTDLGAAGILALLAAGVLVLA